MLIAQITDTHIKLPGRLAYRQVDTAARLQACVQRLLTLDPAPDLVVMTGDLTDLGRPEEYVHLQQLLAPLPQPILAVPGNHDARDSMRDAFAHQPFAPDASAYLQFVQAVGQGEDALHIVGLDTLLPGEGGGELCATRLDWLSRTLERLRPHPVLVLMHHPPFITGIAHMDHIGLQGRTEFTRIVAQHPHIQAILCGHLHRHIVTQCGGRLVMTSPSPAHQVAFDLSPDGPSRFRLEPPAFLLHRWTEGTLVSHQVLVDDYPGPYPFFSPDGQLID